MAVPDPKDRSSNIQNYPFFIFWENWERKASCRCCSSACLPPRPSEALGIRGSTGLCPSLSSHWSPDNTRRDLHYPHALSSPKPTHTTSLHRPHPRPHAPRISPLPSVSTFVFLVVIWSLQRCAKTLRSVTPWSPGLSPSPAHRSPHSPLLSRPRPVLRAPTHCLTVSSASHPFVFARYSRHALRSRFITLLPSSLLSSSSSSAALRSAHPSAIRSFDDHDDPHPCLSTATLTRPQCCSLATSTGWCGWRLPTRTRTRTNFVSRPLYCFATDHQLSFPDSAHTPTFSIRSLWEETSCAWGSSNGIDMALEVTKPRCWCESVPCRSWSYSRQMRPCEPPGRTSS